MNILSIQSSVAYGHVGNSAAVFLLQRMGLEVWPVNTVHFSNHTGYGQWRGSVLPAEDVAGIVRGIEELGVLPGCDAVLSGYMGDASLGEVIVGAVARVKEHDGKAIYCCDPVMGNAGRGSRGLFVDEHQRPSKVPTAAPAASLTRPVASERAVGTAPGTARCGDCTDRVLLVEEPGIKRVFLIDAGVAVGT